MKSDTKTKLEFNLVVTLLLMSQDKYLSNLLSKSVGDNFKLYITQAQSNIFGSSEIIEEIFNDIIMETESYVERYEYLSKSKKLEKMLTTAVVEKEPTAKSIKFKGAILADAEKNGETDRHRALLALNDLKNAQRRLRNLCDKDFLTDDEYRTLRASIATFNVKVSGLEQKKYIKNRK